jgi:hypothetical protein
VGRFEETARLRRNPPAPPLRPGAGGLRLFALVIPDGCRGAVTEGLSPILNAHSQTIWQTQTPRELQGRVFSVRRLIAQCTSPLGTVLAGIFSGLLNPGMVMGVMGLVLAVFCLGQMFNPYLLRVEDKAYLDRLAEQRQAAD